MSSHSETESSTDILSQLPARIHSVIDETAQTMPDRVALLENDGSITYGELQRAVTDVAAKLSHLGVRPGDRVMIVSENCIALAGVLFGVSRLDAWAIVVNPRMSARELDQIRDHSGARIVVLTAGLSNEALAHAARYQAPTVTMGPFADIAVSSINEQTVPEPVEALAKDQVAVLIYTSGTTGTPKGVMLTHENLLFSAKTTGTLRRMTPDDRQYLVLPVSHIVGISILIVTLMSGASARMVSKADPAALAKAIAEQGITIVNGVPATYQRLLEYKTLSGVKKLSTGSLRIISVAGAPLDLDLKSRVEAELGLSLLNGYGITECSPGLSGVRIDGPRNDQGVGPLLPGVEAKIIGLDGTPKPASEVGELHVRGRNVMRGYYRAPDLTAKAIDPEGWFNTGDLARFEGDCLFIVGRTKEMIIRSGFNVYPAEVEAVLSSHPMVVQSAVVGRSVEGNEEVVAFVQLLQGSETTAADLMAYVSPQLTSYKRPSEIIVLPVLPATSTGKLLKHKLAETLRDQASAS